MRKSLELQGTSVSDELFDTLDCNFTVNRPVDTKSIMEEMQMQYNMGAISVQTIIENSKHTSNAALELDRLAAEKVIDSAIPNNGKDKSVREVDNQNIVNTLE